MTTWMDLSGEVSATRTPVFDVVADGCRVVGMHELVECREVNSGLHFHVMVPLDALQGRATGKDADAAVLAYAAERWAAMQRLARAGRTAA